MTRRKLIEISPQFPVFTILKLIHTRAGDGSTCTDHLHAADQTPDQKYRSDSQRRTIFLPIILEFLRFFHSSHSFAAIHAFSASSSVFHEPQISSHSVCHAIPVMASILTIQKFQQIACFSFRSPHIPDFLRTADTLYLLAVHLSGRFPQNTPAESGCFDRPDAHLTACQTIPCDKPRILKSQRISKHRKTLAWRRMIFSPSARSGRVLNSRAQ